MRKSRGLLSGKFIKLTYFYHFAILSILQLAWKSRWVHSSKSVPFLYKFMKKIKLTQGKYAIVDDEDFAYLNQWKWYFNNKGYAVKNNWENKKWKTIYMHRLIMNTLKKMETDHINGNKLDNRRCNLRICTKSQNQINSNVNIKNSSGYKGVCWHKDRNKWQVQIEFNGKKYYLGYFVDKIGAAKAYNQKAKELFGEFAYLNKV